MSLHRGMKSATSPSNMTIYSKNLVLKGMFNRKLQFLRYHFPIKRLISSFTLVLLGNIKNSLPTFGKSFMKSAKKLGSRFTLQDMEQEKRRLLNRLALQKKIVSVDSSLGIYSLQLCKQAAELSLSIRYQFISQQLLMSHLPSFTGNTQNFGILRRQKELFLEKMRPFQSIRSTLR